MKAVWSLSVKRGQGWGACGECCKRATKRQHLGQGPLLQYISPLLHVSNLLSAHVVQTLIVSLGHWTISEPYSSEKKDQYRSIQQWKKCQSAQRAQIN